MDSQDLVQDYTVDVKKLDDEVKKLQTDNKKLRSEQEKLNDDFKKGKIDSKEYDKALKNNSQSLKQNRTDAKNLAGAIGEVSNSQKDLTRVFSRVTGMVTGALGSLVSAVEQYREKLTQAREEAKKLAEAQAIEKVKKKYEDLFNTEDEHIKEIEKMMKRQQASGESTEAYEQSKANAITEQLNAAKKLNDELKDQLVLDKTIALERKTMFLGGEGEKQMRAANLKVKETQEAIKKVEERITTLNALQINYEEELLLKKLANEKKLRDQQAENERKAQEERLKYINEQYKLQTDLRKKIEDLEILMIEDADEQKIAKIQLEEKRQLEALDKEYKTATSNNKKLINQTKDFVKEYTKIQIKAIKEPTKVLDAELTSATEKMEKFLTTYTSHIADEYSKVALSQSALFNIYKNKIYEELYKTDYKPFLESLKADVESYFKEVDVSVEGVSEKLLIYKNNLDDFQKNEIETMSELVEINQKYDKQTAEVQTEAQNRLKTINDAYILEEKRFNEALERSKADGKYIEEDWEKSRLEMQRQRAQQQVDVANWANDTIKIIELNRINEVEVAEYESNERRKELISEYVDSVSNMFGEVGSVFDALSETEEEGSKKSIALQRASAYMSMAVALAQGISKAVSSSKNWIEAIAAIASTTAALIVQFAKVKKLEKQSDEKAKYAKGGYVSGPGSSTSDSIDAKLSNGESVMTAKATTKYGTLLSALNQSVGGAPITRAGQQDDFVRQLALAISSMPAPVVSVESIDRQRDVVRQVDVLSKL